MEELRILSPTGIVGYGFPEDSFRRGIEKKPHLIACDAGSTDPGPYYLGSGKPFTTKSAVKRDLGLMLRAARELDIPLIIGSAGGAGGAPHLARDCEIILELAREHKLSMCLAAISAQLDTEYLLDRLAAGHIRPLGPGKPPEPQDFKDSVRVVAQMGVEPILAALEEGANVILCGRCYDPAAFAAFAIAKGYSQALSIHLGKILECAAIAAVPGSGSDCVMGYLGQDYFMIEPLSPERRCTVSSVAAHTLYEKSDPSFLPGPGGALDLRECSFTQVNERRVMVKGSRFVPEERKTVKLEGARLEGYRTISIAGNRDRAFISRIDDILENLKQRVAENLFGTDIDYKLDFILYGKNGVMGHLEPRTEIASHELGIVIDAVAPTQEQAGTVCSVARSTLLHYGYPGRIATAGNLAFPYSPSDIDMGAVYTFSIYALLEEDDPAALFPRQYRNLVKGEIVP